MSDWGDRIRAKLDEHSMSVAALARACGIKPPSVHDWLNGKTKAIEGANLIRAASALSVTPEWILTGRGPRERAASASPAPPAPALSPDALRLAQVYDHASPAQRAAFDALARGYEDAGAGKTKP